MLRQLTREEAVAFEDWRGWPHKMRAAFQLRQDRLCMPFDVFHEAVEKALGRPVWTHEFGLNPKGLLEELQGKGDAPTMEEILALVPSEKLIVVQIDEGAGD